MAITAKLKVVKWKKIIFLAKMRRHDPLYEKFNICHLLKQQQQGRIGDRFVRNRLQTSKDLLSRLELESELIGHAGCVNCLEWSDNGTVLASGSDDYHILLWDPFRHKLLQDVVTPHRGNIFSVKFMPKTDCKTVVSSAGDARIYGFDLNHPDTPLFKCSCHGARIKRMAVGNETPHLFWSASEDGCVFQFDLREPHQCSAEEKIVLINLTHHTSRFAEVKCIAINSRRPELLAIGSNDAYARIFDRRMIKCTSLPNTEATESFLSWHLDHLPKSCITYFAPAHLQTSHAMAASKAATFVSFSPDGRELLVNMGSEQIYLYDIFDSKQATLFELPPYAADTREAKRSNLMIPDEVEKMKKRGNDLLDSAKFTEAINQYTLAILETPTPYPTLYLNRATALMKRKWRGDNYAALRDCKMALELDAGYVKAHFRMARALLELDVPQEAKECLEEMKRRFADHANNHSVMMLEKDIDLAINSKQSNHAANERAELSDNEMHWRSLAKDYKERFVGRSNSKTDIKEANFFGPDGKYIVAGSDDGNLFIFERPSGAVVDVLNADKSIVNCVQPHPYICLLASSGIDHEIRLWSPQPEVSNKPKHRILDLNLHENHLRMSQDPFELNSFLSPVCRSS